MKFCSLLRHLRHGGYAHIGFCVPLRPSVHSGIGAASRCGSTGLRNATGVPSADLEVFPATPCNFRSFNPHAVRLQGCILFRVTPPSTSRVVSHDRLSSGLFPFDRSGGCGFVQTAMSGLRHLQGLVSLVAPLSPPLASPEYFIQVRPWGSPLQGLFLLRTARASRPSHTPMPLVSFASRCARNRTSGLTSRRKPSLETGGKADHEPLPSWGFASPGFSTGRPLRFRGTSTGFTLRASDPHRCLPRL